MKSQHVIPVNFILILSLLAGCTWISRSNTKATVHGANQDCSICHFSHKTKGTGLLNKTISELCLECHPDRKGPPLEHAVDVVPSMEVKGLLLTGGKMTCVTCHDSHKKTYKHMLRVSPESLCQACHKL